MACSNYKSTLQHVMIRGSLDVDKCEHGVFAYARMHRTPRKTNAMCSQTTAVDHERAIPKTHQLRTVS